MATYGEKGSSTFFLEVAAEKFFDSPIVTEIEPFGIFYPAESYYSRYYDRNPEAGYWQAIIDPKLAKLRWEFQKFLKEN